MLEGEVMTYETSVGSGRWAFWDAAGAGASSQAHDEARDWGRLQYPLTMQEQYAVRLRVLGWKGSLASKFSK